MAEGDEKMKMMRVSRQFVESVIVTCIEADSIIQVGLFGRIIFG